MMMLVKESGADLLIRLLAMNRISSQSGVSGRSVTFRFGCLRVTRDQSLVPVFVLRLVSLILRAGLASSEAGPVLLLQSPVS